MSMKFSEMVSEQTGADLDAKHGFPISRMIEALQRINTASPSNANAGSAFSMANHTAAIASTALHDILDHLNSLEAAASAPAPRTADEICVNNLVFHANDGSALVLALDYSNSILIPTSAKQLLDLVLTQIERTPLNMNDWKSAVVRFNGLKTLTLPSAIISNLMIWRGMLRSGVYPDHVLKQVDVYIDGMHKLPGINVVNGDPAARAEWEGCIKCAELFAETLGKQIAAEA